MSAAERRAGASLAGVFGLRMFGLFLILPVLSVHASHLAGGDNLALVGMALGIYGLAQGFLQIPFGMASDRWGRKPVLYVGLAVFALGSFLGVGATDIWTVIAARSNPSPIVRMSTLRSGNELRSSAVLLYITSAAITPNSVHKPNVSRIRRRKFGLRRESAKRVPTLLRVSMTSLHPLYKLIRPRN